MQRLVGIIMGSRSDWKTIQPATDKLASLRVSHEVRIVSAHRKPDKLRGYVDLAFTRGLQVIIACAGSSANLPNMLATMTSLPVIGVPIPSKGRNGADSLLSLANMPTDVPFDITPLSHDQAENAALFAAHMLGNIYPPIRKAIVESQQQRNITFAAPDPCYGT